MLKNLGKWDMSKNECTFKGKPFKKAIRREYRLLSDEERNRYVVKIFFSFLITQTFLHKITSPQKLRQFFSDFFTDNFCVHVKIYQT